MRRYSPFLIVPLIFLLDRLSKAHIENLIPLNGSIDYMTFFSLVHVRNYGGVFSLFSRYKYSQILFTLLPLFIVLWLVFLLIRKELSFSNKLSLLLIIGGALGNLYDRIVKGYVIDFLDFHYRSFHWPAFNLADASVTTGVFLWIFIELRKGR